MGLACWPYLAGWLRQHSLLRRKIGQARSACIDRSFSIICILKSVFVFGQIVRIGSCGRHCDEGCTFVTSTDTAN